MKPNHVPGFLMTHSALAVVLGLLCAWVIDLGNSAPVVVLGTGLGAGLLLSAGAVATFLVQRMALWGWKRYLRAQASEAVHRRTQRSSRRGRRCDARPTRGTSRSQSASVAT